MRWRVIPAKNRLFIKLLIIILCTLYILTVSLVYEKNSGKIYKIPWSNELEEQNYNTNSYTSENSILKYVIVVQVHNRAVHLKFLIDSFSVVEDISDALIIFSHDVFDPEINSLIQKIRFCRFKQIFYPHAIQKYPNSFPGDDPNDCPWNINQEKAKEIKCLNAANPDKYGHYRQAKITQTKHHWWWKANYIFSNLKDIENFNGSVVFLEEDHYVSPDMLHVLNLLENACKNTDCNMMGLGAEKLRYEYEKTNEKVELTGYITNKGLVLNSATWNKIKSCAKYFCEYDDYNWDWTLFHVSAKCFKLKSVIASNTRVFHLGECSGLHHIGTCDPRNALLKAEKLVKNYLHNLFPESINILNFSMNAVVGSRENGGWADKRDRELCLNISNNKDFL